MRVELFDFDLPAALIAAHPVVPRDAARLLEVDGAALHDRHVRDLPALLRPGDLLVANDTKVIPARLHGKRGAAGIELLLHRQLGGSRWQAFARPAKKLKPGDRVVMAEDFVATVIDKQDGGEVTVDFALPEADFFALLARHGEVPLPPYIKRPDGPDSADRDDYQTIFAAHPGAVAAPTAGLHFTPALLQALQDKGIGRVTLTLHVGAGTFQPVKVEDTHEHVMHREWGCIDATTAATINAVRSNGGRIVAVGTTSLRLLESAARDDGRIETFAGDTGIFITPGYRFKAVDLLLTNFHLPRSTLFMLVSAFSGLARMRAAYEHAKAAGYRFYSYGDACLLHGAEAA
jgi:S-adenosylmethionine:tRNA ribosyltransferase-isomerase